MKTKKKELPSKQEDSRIRKGVEQLKPNLKLISMNEIQTEEVAWLWYPYLPRGKLTIIQGDPGEGKTTFVLAVIAALTTGASLPESSQELKPLNVIYQTAEDGLADTIKPRLDAAGADCSRVLVIDESQRELTLYDERLEQAVHQTGAQLVVLDPIQAYLGNDVDMHHANEVRPVLKRVAAMSERTGCAVILIGHMNKAQGLKSGYRGLGSIDFRAAARSVLVVGRLKEDPTVRIVAQDKNSLAPEGRSVVFQLDEEREFHGRRCAQRWRKTPDQDHTDGRRIGADAHGACPGRSRAVPGQRLGRVRTHTDDRQKESGCDL